jgi:3-dehydroquinate synthase
MYELQIESSSESYRVRFLPLNQVRFEDYDFVICDKFFQGRFDIDSTRLYLIQADERKKDLLEVERICTAMQSAKVNRNSKILAIGGGFIQDLSTMVAAIYMRGVAWDYIPTTLTAMADSCVGGKSSINLSNAKNTLGLIHPPKGIVVASETLSSLQAVDRISGLMESVKICFARGPEYLFEFTGNPESDVSYQGTNLDSLIFTSLSAKKWFVERDEFDLNERQLLNFGHTFGHAIESATDFGIRHGVAVGLGMLAALSHSGSQSSESTEILRSYIKKSLEPILGSLLDSCNSISSRSSFSVFGKSSPHV